MRHALRTSSTAQARLQLHPHASRQGACIAMVRAAPVCGATQHIVHTYEDMYMHIDLGEAHAQDAQDAPVDGIPVADRRREAHLPASRGTP